MQNMIGMLAQSFGINPNVASMAVNGATKMFLQKSTPKAASGLYLLYPRILLINLVTMINKNLKQHKIM
ncbi:MAG: hypothetical protein ACRD8K_10340 [Nitrososphaeraceae archaeon]